jgi:hypothetical protein
MANYKTTARTEWRALPALLVEDLIPKFLFTAKLKVGFCVLSLLWLNSLHES